MARSVETGNCWRWECKNGTDTLKRVWQCNWNFSLKFWWPSNYSFRVYLQKKLNICPWKDMYAKVYSGVIHTRKKIEAMQMSISWWVDEENDIPSIWKNYSIKDSSHKWQNVAWFILQIVLKRNWVIKKSRLGFPVAGGAPLKREASGWGTQLGGAAFGNRRSFRVSVVSKAGLWWSLQNWINLPKIITFYLKADQFTVYKLYHN